jgi:glycosyltransferase involved in cell wall biosynthesis
MEINRIQISWVIASRNRYERLKWNLEYLLAHINENEEIIVVDGNSDDETESYLTQLKNDGRIQTYIRGKDKNQAHAWNKGFLAAKGKYIKKMIDDDILDIISIRKCISKMNENPEADICISEDMSMDVYNPNSIMRHSRYDAYTKWKNGEVPSFTFGDVHMIIRRSSLALIGLYDTSFIMMDYEYSLRISYLGSGILFYTGCNALSIISNETITANASRKQLMKEGSRANAMYEYAGDRANISQWSKIKIFIGKKRDRILKIKHVNQKENKALSSTTEIQNLYNNALARLMQENNLHNGKFYFHKPVKSIK